MKQTLDEAIGRRIDGIRWRIDRHSAIRDGDKIGKDGGVKAPEDEPRIGYEILVQVHSIYLTRFSPPAPRQEFIKGTIDTGDESVEGTRSSVGQSKQGRASE
jgi:hypothetical protein